MRERDLEPAEGQEGDDQKEPSMEDILSSIRRILSEEDEGEGEEKAEAAAPEPEPEPKPEPETESEPEPEPEPVIDMVEPEPEPEPEPVIDLVEPAFEPEPEPEPAWEPEPGPLPVFGPEPASPPREDVFDLTPTMVAPAAGSGDIVSGETARTSTDVLSELARAILNRRDIGVGSRDLTLESMVREMLRPLLREWLDRNLPYLIERLVKKEIDLMINRAERLED